MRKIPKAGIITIAFDDAYMDTYRHAVTCLDRLNIKSTVAVPFSAIGKTFEKRPVMGKKEIRALQKRGHEIASHTITHANLLKLSGKDKNAVIREIAESGRLLGRLTGRVPRSFVFPYINRNQSKSLRGKTKAFYSSARITSNDPVFNELPVKDPYSIAGFAVTKKHSLSYLKKQVDLAAEKKLWLIEVFHLVGKKNTKSAHRSAPYRFFMSINDFEKHVDYMLSKNVRILTQNQVIRKCSTKS